MKQSRAAYWSFGQACVRGGLFSVILLSAALLPVKSPAAGPTGSIGTNIIEIDANLFPNGANGFDWVKDSLPNTDTPGVTNDIATGLIPNVTAAPGGTGHWNGARIVDGLDGNDQDIFLNGGKENDTSTWNVGPGTVGSSKYDITQAYLANNTTTLFFAMERRGNNGTTAFDFEFNQASPKSTYVPTRTVGDVLFTFELQGSGNTGSATPHFFVWNGTAYAERNPPPASLKLVINQAAIPGEPWGFVDSKGNWVLGNIDRFEFAEASVNILDAFPNFKPCNNALFVQVRTRSSATDTSDLKDTTKIFPYLFGGPDAEVSLSTTCLGQLVFNGSNSRDSKGGTGLTYLWNFTPPSGVTLSGASITGPVGGVYHSTAISGTADVTFPTGVDSASIKVSLTVTEGVGCTNNSGDVNFTVERPLQVSITDKAMSGANLSVTLTASAKPASGTTFQWQRKNASNVFVNIAGQTGSTLTYTNFQADASASIVNFNALGDPYQAQLYQVVIRVHAERTVNGVVCTADSAPVTVKKLIAVDP